MRVLDVCKSYFQGFHDIAHCKKNDAKTNALAALKIVSYFTVVIPLGFTALFTAASLYGRIKIKSRSRQDVSIGNQAKKMIGKKDKSKEIKLTPEEIRFVAQQAAEGELRHTGGPSGHIYNELLDMVREASIEEIPYIIEGAMGHEYSTGLKKVLGELLRIRELDKSDLDKEKLKSAIQTITEKELLKLIDISNLSSLTEDFEYRIDFGFYNDLELELLKKYGEELLLSDAGLKQIGDYINHIKALCEKTKDMPQLLYA